MAYEVKLDVFEGPLDLLLQLIERHDLDITTVSLAAIADQYLAYIAQIDSIAPDILADFLVVAARLILIKSQALLPRPPAPAVEEQEDVGEDLARQLQEYKRFKEAATLLKSRDEQGLHSYLRLAASGMTPRVHLEGVTLADLVTAMQNALAALPEAPAAPDILRRQFTVEEKISVIQQAVALGGVSLGALLSRVSSRLEAIVTFLALLELVKQQRVLVQQQAIFGEIMIAPSVPAGAATGEPARPPA